MGYSTRLKVIVIEELSDMRARIKSTLQSVDGMDTVLAYKDLKSVKELIMIGGCDCNMMFISDRFGEEALQKFMGEISNTEVRKDSAFVLMLSERKNVSVKLTYGLKIGFDAFLFEPYSVDNLNEIVETAKSVKQDRLGVRVQAAVSAMVKDCLYSISNVSDALKKGQDTSSALKQFQDVAEVLESYLHTQRRAVDVYYEILMHESFKAIPASEIKNPLMLCSPTQMKERIKRLKLKTVAPVENVKEQDEEKSPNCQRRNNLGGFVIRKR